MTFIHATAPITEDDDVLRAHLDRADVAPLLCALAYITGDLTLLRDELRPDPDLMLTPDAGITPERQAEARALALEVLGRFRDEGSVPAPPPDTEGLAKILSFLVGGVSIEEYLPLFLEELGIEGHDLRAPDWSKDAIASDRDFHVVIIGAGMSGILAAHRLQEAGVPFVIVEKNHDVGGTWLENTYPGCRVDVPNHFYSYSFAQRDDWPQHFSSQDVLLDYFRGCVDEFGLRPHIRFGTEVCSAEFDDETNRWSVHLRTPDGTEETIVADAVVSAVGQLNRPLFPEIEGRDRFAGPSFHSAVWDHSIDLAGKRVAVIGTGASAVQFVPQLAGVAAQLDVYQRTPPWLAPTPEYYQDVPAAAQWLAAHVPSYTHWSRFWLFWRNAEGMLPLVVVDPDWPPGGESVSLMNEMLRLLLVQYLEEQFGDDPDLLAKVTPHYPPSAKRMLRDDGIWARTLKRDDVDLITAPIVEITESGVRTSDGGEHPADVIVYGTGFQASRFLTPIRVTGRGGADLHEQWAGDARAYLGVTVPGFPNLFLLYGPNTNIVINGSIIFFSECEVRYLVGCIRLLLETGHAALDCRTEVHDAFNELIDEGNRLRAWGASDVSSWYKSASGRVAQNWPFSLLEYWQRTLVPDQDDYELLSR